MRVEGEVVLDQSAPPSPDATGAPGSGAAVPKVGPVWPVSLQNKHRQRMYVRLLTVAVDIVAICAAFLIASLIRFGDVFHSQALNMVAVVIPLYLVTAANNHSYSISSLVKARAGASNAVLAFLLALSAVGLVVFFLKVSTDFSRAVFGTGAALAVLLIPLGRFVLSDFARKLFGRSTLNEVIIEDGVVAPSRTDTLVLNAEQNKLSPRLDDPAMLDRLGRYLQHADRVIVACAPERRWLWALALKGADVHGEVFAPELDTLGPLGIERYDSSHTLVLATGPLAFADRAMKRAFDLVLTVATLPVTLPLMLAIAIAVKLDSPGPVIFSQERVGLGNRIFRIYKFRSMHIGKLDGSGARSTGRDDDRITRVGRFIRASSLDEAPQIFNVLSGAMSIVGPRPHALGSRAEDRLFWDIDSAYWHRHAVKPGLTGLAQVRGYRGATETVTDLSNRLQADLEYLNGWSIWRDISIIIATFRVLVHRNAY